MRHLGAYVKDQRSRRGLTVAQLADAVGVSPSYIVLIESDHANVPGRVRFLCVRRFSHRL